MRHRILNRLSRFFFYPHFNLLLTVLLNFRTLPFNQAVKLPIYVYGHWKFPCLDGDIVLSNVSIKRGVIKIGLNVAQYVTTGAGMITLLDGSQLVISKNVKISQGVNIIVFKNAIFSLGENSNLGDNVKIICSKNITIGSNTDITWECQVMDYGTHYIADLNSNEIKRISVPIEIGSYCWIGNRTTIMPGTKLPSHTIVGSNSLLNKDYISQDLPSKSLIGGIPAKLIRTNVFRLRNHENELFLSSVFNDLNIHSINCNKLPYDEIK